MIKQLRLSRFATPVRNPRPPFVIEAVESRLLMSTNGWKSAVSGNWDDATKWSLGHVPLASEDVTIANAGSFTVSIHGQSNVANSVKLGGPGSSPTLNDTADDTTGYAFLTVANGLTNNGTIILGNTSVAGYYSKITVTAGALTNAAGATIIASASANASAQTVNDSISGTIINAGTLNITSAKGVTFSQNTFTNTGTIAIASGVTVTFSGGTFNQNGGSITGASAMLVFNSVTVQLGAGLSTSSMPLLSLTQTTVNGPGTLTSAAGKTLVLTNTTFNAPVVNQGTLVIHGQGGAFNGSFTTTAGSTLNVTADDTTGYAFLTVAAGFTNNGTIILGNTSVAGYYSRITLTAGTLTNAAGATIIASASANVSSQAINDSISGAFVNAGTLSITSSKGIMLTGGLSSVGGKIFIVAGSTLTVSGAATIGTSTFSGSGTVNFSNDTIAIASSGVTLGSGVAFRLNGSTVNGPGALTNAAGSTLALTNTTFNAPVVNQGTLVIHGQGSALNGSFTTTAGSTLNVTADDTTGYAFLTVANGFTNNGTIILGNTSVAGYYSRMILTAGTLTNAAGATIIASASANVSSQAVNDSISGTIFNAGTLSITSSKGIMITGDYTQTAAGTYAIQLFSSSSGQVGAFKVSGKATLAGLLDIYLASGFHPAVGNTLAAMVYTSRAGDFTALDGYSVGGGVALSKAPGSTEYDLKGVVVPADAVAPKAGTLTVRTPVVLAKTVQFTVTFSDNVAIDVTTLGNANVQVTGPKGFSQMAKLVSVSKSNNGTPRTATYSITPTIGRVDVGANGSYTAKLVAASVKDTRGNAVPAGTLGTFVVSVAAKLVITATPASVVAGKPIAPAVVVKIQDQSGAVITTDNSNVTITIATGPSITIGGTPTVAAKNGIATFSNLIINKAGTYTLKASDGADAPGLSKSFIVKPAAAAKLVVLSIPSTAKVGKAIAPAVKVAVEDALGNVVVTDTSTIKLSIATGPAGGALSGVVSVKAVAGIATFSGLLLSKAGPYTLKGVDGFLTAAVSASVTVS